jgi:hypothetical protein
VVQTGLLVQVLCALSALWAVGAAAQPGHGPRATVDQRFTSMHPNTPTGLSWSGSYHAAGDPKGNPPYLRRMVFYPPKGLRYDTSAPARCTATDAQLAVQGPDACPAASRIGGGKVEGLFYVPFSQGSILFDHYKHDAIVLNNTNEQIVLVHSEGYTVQRGTVHPDNSIEFNPTTCFPASPTGHCADDYILQLKSSTFLPRYTRTSGGTTRAYATTPPRCPRRGHWRTTVAFWWGNGATERVATTQPCKRPRKSQSHT